MKAQLIIAGNSKQAIQCAKLRGMNALEYIVVHDAHDLNQCVEPGRTVWLVGTYYRRKDWPQLHSQCKARQLETVEVSYGR